MHHFNVARASAPASSALAERLCSFVLDRHPIAIEAVRAALRAASPASPEAPQAFPRRAPQGAQRIDVRDVRTRRRVCPHVNAWSRRQRTDRRVRRLFAREAIAASLTPDERREILRGMVLTRAVDNRLKQLFTSGEVSYQGVPFQAKVSGRSGRRRSTRLRSVCGTPRGATKQDTGVEMSLVR